MNWELGGGGRENKTALFDCQCSVGLSCSLEKFLLLINHGLRNMTVSSFFESPLIGLSIICGTPYLN